MILPSTLKLSPEILSLIAEIDEFKGRWTALRDLQPDRLNTLRRIATIESIGSSTRIEGVRLSNEEIERLLSNVAIRSFSTRDEQEVAGYAEVMETIFSAYSEISLSENYIKQLHKTLLKHSTKDNYHKGEYKKQPNHIEAFDQEGESVGIIFETASPFDTPRLMQELLSWTNEEFDSKSFHPLLTLSIFVLYFLAIHPFLDGNGRLSRALTTFLLLRNGYSYAMYSSLERVIEENKSTYYVELRRAQETLRKQTPEVESWILFFLSSLKTQKDVLIQKLEREKILYQLSSLPAQIVELTRQHGRLKMSQIEQATGANRNTLKLKVRELVNSGHLQKHGQGKGTWYTL